MVRIPQEFQDKLDEFLEVMLELDEIIKSLPQDVLFKLDEKYPKYLPDFEDFTWDMYGWGTSLDIASPEFALEEATKEEIQANNLDLFDTE